MVIKEIDWRVEENQLGAFDYEFIYAELDLIFLTVFHSTCQLVDE